MASDEDKNREELLTEVRRLRAQLDDLEGQEAEHNELVSRLKISKERFQAVTENANDCVWELDENFVYTFVTSQFKDVLGYDADEMVGRQPFDFMPPDEAKLAAGAMREFLAQGRLFTGLEHQKWHKEGWLVHLESYGVPIIDKDGKPSGYRGVDRDITERKQAQEQLRNAHKELEKRVRERTEELREANKKLQREIEERKRAQNELAKAEREKAVILESMSEHVIYHDPRFRIQWANRAAADSVGLELEDLKGRFCYEVWQGRDDKCAGCPIDQARQSGQAEEAEMETPDGRAWWIRGSPVKDEDGQQVGFIEVTREITERKRAQEALRKSEERLSSIYEASPSVIALSTVEDGRYVEVNQAFGRLMGWTAEEAIGQTAFELEIWAEPAEEQRRRFVRLLKDEGQIENEEFVFRHKSGSILHGLISATLVDIEDETYILTIVEDITERKRAEEALRESEARYATVAEMANDGIAIVQDGVHKFANEAESRITGYSVEELMGMPISKLIAEEDKELVEERYEERLQGENPPSVYELRIRKKDGTERCAEISVSRIQYQDAGAELVIIRDITERKDAEIALRDSAEKFRTLARSVGAYRNTGGPEGKFLEAGPAIANIFGYDSTEEFLTVRVADLYRCREDRSEFVRKMKEAGGRLDGELLPLKRKDGTPIWVSITAQAHFDENGEIEYMDGVAMDVTERIEAQKALEESEKKYKTLVENSHQDVVIFQGTPPTVVFTNSQVGRLLGYEPEEVEGWSFEKLLSHAHPDERNKIRERNKARMRGEAVPSRYELRVKTREGNWRWMEVFVSQIKYRGEPALLGVFIDIHERKMAEEALKQSEKRYRDLFEHSFSAIFVHDTDGNILHVNKRAEKMLGYTAEELESMNVADFHPENELDNSQQALEEVVEKGYTCFKIPFKKKDGTLLSAQISASSWETDDGALIQGIVRELGKNPCEEATDE